jgi:hypothetical protein
MSRKRWYLVYTHTNEMEAGTFRDGIEDVEVALKATNEDEAVAEAKAKWAEIEIVSKARWEEQKRTWKQPPASPTEWGPHDPRVIHKISLQ